MAFISLGQIDIRREAFYFYLAFSGLCNTPEMDWVNPDALYERFRQRFHLAEDELAVCLDAYHACQSAAVDEKEMQALYAPLGPGGLCAASLIECAIPTGNDPDKLRRMLCFVLEMPEGSDKDETAFLQALADENMTDGLRWLCASLLHDLPRLAAREDALLAPVISVLQDFKPRFEALISSWQGRMLAETDNRAHPPAFFESAGLKLDDQPLLLIPSIFGITDITISGEQLLLPHTTRIPVYCGVYVDVMQNMLHLEKNDEKQLLNMLHALDDKNRLQILKALEGKPLNGRQLATLTGLSPATVSHHMNELVGASLAGIEKKGVSIEYRQNKSQVQLLINQLKTQLLGE